MSPGVMKEQTEKNSHKTQSPHLREAADSDSLHYRTQPKQSAMYKENHYVVRLLQ